MLPVERARPPPVASTRTDCIQSEFILICRFVVLDAFATLHWRTVLRRTLVYTSAKKCNLSHF